MLPEVCSSSCQSESDVFLLPKNCVIPTSVSVDEATASRRKQRAVKLMNNQHQPANQADSTQNARCLCPKKMQLLSVIF
jgi:hypothetical protein